MDALSLFVDVPICAFRPRWSREYQDTYSCPPPSTVFGMLLSLSGVDRQERAEYAGVQIALAVEDMPECSRVFRKLRRVPQNPGKKRDLQDDLLNRRPEYQDLLHGLRLWVWLNNDDAGQKLIARVKHALDPKTRGEILRYGGLSLGESSHLVDEISIKKPEGDGRFLCRDKDGPLSLTTWVDYPKSGESDSNMERFMLSEPTLLDKPPEPDQRWILIQPRSNQVPRQ